MADDTAPPSSDPPAFSLLDGLYGSDPADGEGPGEPMELADPLGADLPVSLSTAATRDLRNIPSAGAVPLEGFLAECVTLEPMALTEELARGPADFARWNELYATATEVYLQAKVEVGRVRARRGIHFRRQRTFIAQANRMTSVSESMIDDLVSVDPEVIAAEDRLIVADRDRTRIRGILAALNRKAEALVSIGAHFRAEMQWTSPHVNLPGGRRGT